MSLHNIDNERPNPLVLLATAMDAVKDHGYDEVVVIVMKPDADLVNWSTMPVSHLTYAAALLNKIVADRLGV